MRILRGAAAAAEVEQVDPRGAQVEQAADSGAGSSNSSSDLVAKSQEQPVALTAVVKDDEKQEPAKALRILEHQLEQVSKAHDEHKVQSQEPAFAQAAASGAATVARPELAWILEHGALSFVNEDAIGTPVQLSNSGLGAAGGGLEKLPYLEVCTAAFAAWKDSVKDLKADPIPYQRRNLFCVPDHACTRPETTNSKSVDSAERARRQVFGNTFQNPKELVAAFDPGLGGGGAHHHRVVAELCPRPWARRGALHAHHTQRPSASVVCAHGFVEKDLLIGYLSFKKEVVDHMILVL
jgi:hypothetical protein